MSDWNIQVQPAKRPRPPRRPIHVLGLIPRWLGYTVLIVGGLTAAVLVYGTPHLLITYEGYRTGGRFVSHSRCHYYGVEGWRETRPQARFCARVRLLPIKWMTPPAESHLLIP